MLYLIPSIFIVVIVSIIFDYYLNKESKKKGEIDGRNV